MPQIVSYDLHEDDIYLINNTDVWPYYAVIAPLYARLFYYKIYCSAARDLSAPILLSFRYF
jgi:hypothetical protein